VRRGETERECGLGGCVLFFRGKEEMEGGRSSGRKKEIESSKLTCPPLWGKREKPERMSSREPGCDNSDNRQKHTAFTPHLN